MFIHDSHLPQLLTCDNYTSPEQLAREMERLFRPGWHVAGIKSDAPSLRVQRGLNPPVRPSAGVACVCEDAVSPFRSPSAARPLPNGRRRAARRWRQKDDEDEGLNSV